MYDSEEYYKDFTEDNYRHLLDIAKDKFSFTNYRDFNTVSNPIIWRHDVDFSIHRSLALAEIEKEKSVSSIFFVQICSEFYNLFETMNKNKLLKIHELGHEIGIHFNSEKYDIESEEDLEKYISFEKYSLEMFLNIPIKYVSFHNPTLMNIDYHTEKFNGVINAYAKSISEKFKYVSDSNGYWRFDRLEDVLIESEGFLHVLTHPNWWTPQAMSPYNRILRSIDGRKKNILDIYENTLKKDNRKNVR